MFSRGCSIQGPAQAIRTGCLAELLLRFDLDLRRPATGSGRCGDQCRNAVAYPGKILQRSPSCGNNSKDNIGIDERLLLSFANGW